MSHYNHFSFGYSATPQLPQGTKIGFTNGPGPLRNQGLNLLVEIAPASAFVHQQSNSSKAMTFTTMAHFDTGATLTTIDINLAKHLHLISTGMSPISTANGVTNTPNYAVDIFFINTNLKSIQNLQVSSCNLGHFNLLAAIQNPTDSKNFSILIGRDIMSLWNIVWNGPTSTVLISD